MTTIAYKAGVMAAEGRVTLSDTIMTDCGTKIYRLSDGALCALCGEESYADPLIKYLEGEEDAELPTADTFTALLVEADGAIKLYEGAGDFRVINTSYIALGSGAAFAYGAMDLGATAVEAVEVAIKRDPQSGGLIQVLRLQEEGE